MILSMIGKRIAHGRKQGTIKISQRAEGRGHRVKIPMLYANFFALIYYDDRR